ncbi:crystallin beta/gamma motif-containing protein [Methylibium sp. T29]|nr:crystallin beta/gamma motif-containing protein [Methylibium sp. T29]
MEGLPASVNYRDLTVADFRSVRDRVDAVWSLARSTRMIEIDGQMVEINGAAEALAERLSGEPQAKRERMVGTNTQLDLRMRLAGMRAALRRVEFWADARDGGNTGPFRTYVWQPVSEAVTRYRTQRNDYVNRFLVLLKTIEPTLKPGKIAAPELADGMVFADRSALLHALLHTGNESNLRKLLLGYQWASERPDGSLDTTRWDGFLKRMHAEKRITKADWDFVQATWNLLEEIKPSAQAAHKRMFGHYFAEITAEPVQTPFGELAGGYVPAITDSLLVPEARTHGAMDDLLAGQNSPMFPAVTRGFTKGRIQNYTKPLALDLRMLPAHIDKVARFATLGPVLRDAARLVTRNRTFRSAMDAVDPTAVESMLVPCSSARPLRR